MNLLNFSNLDVKLFKAFMDILKKLKHVRVYNVMLEDGYGVKEHKIVAPNGQYAIAQYSTDPIKASVQYMGWGEVQIDSSSQNHNIFTFWVHINGEYIEIKNGTWEFSYIMQMCCQDLIEKQRSYDNQYN